MKKYIVFLLVLLSGCASVTLLSDNKNCITTREFKVFQALNEGALAYECTFWDGCSYHNQLVYLDWQPDIDYYDDMIVKVPSSKCAIREGVYKYTTKQDILKTVPVIKFEYKDAPKSDKDIVERIEDRKNWLYAACLHDFSVNNLAEDKKFCSCYAENFIEYAFELNSQENAEYSDEALTKKIKKKCGKIPDFMKDIK